MFALLSDASALRKFDAETVAAATRMPVMRPTPLRVSVDDNEEEDGEESIPSACDCCGAPVASEYLRIRCAYCGVTGYCSTRCHTRDSDHHLKVCPGFAEPDDTWFENELQRERDQMQSEIDSSLAAAPEPVSVAGFTGSLDSAPATPRSSGSIRSDNNSDSESESDHDTATSEGSGSEESEYEVDDVPSDDSEDESDEAPVSPDTAPRVVRVVADDTDERLGYDVIDGFLQSALETEDSSPATETTAASSSFGTAEEYFEMPDPAWS